MLTEPLFLLAALGTFLTLLVLVQMFLAIRHDHVIAAAPRHAELESLDRQIAVKRETLLDLEEDLRKRREALAGLAGLGAEVDALTRKRDELLHEWATLDQKRDEVRAMQAETEQAWLERQSALSELSTLQEELKLVQGRLDRAEELVRRIGELENRHSELTDEVRTLEEAARELREAEQEVARLRSLADDLRRANVEAEGRGRALDAELADLSARLAAEREAYANLAAERTDALARLATAQEAVQALESRQRALEAQGAQLAELGDRLTEVRRQLVEAEAERDALAAHLTAAEHTLAKARSAEQSLAALEEMLTRKRAELAAAGGVTDEASVEDRLKELNTRPPVLQQLAAWPIWTPERDRQPEAQALHRVAERFKAVGLEYHPRTQRAFHTSMKVNATTQMTVLAGISGTGKSQLPRQYAAGMGIGFLQVPVQPRWDSPQDLMGFYNYIEGRFRPTDMARALWQMDTLNNGERALDDRLLMVLLDEMNLARVEYYFSDFLSRLESRPAPEAVNNPNLRKDAEIELEIPMPRGTDAKRVFPGYNLLFAGTMNEDESTQSLSDKVVDRANVLRFGAPRKIAGTAAQDRLPDPEALPLDQWRRWIRTVDSVSGQPQVGEALNRMSELMRGFGRPFGHRLGRAVLAYVANYPETEGSDRINEALADQVEMRLLPKLRGVEVDAGETEAQFGELRAFVERTLRDDLLAHAIDEAVATARQKSGQFVWTGVTR